MNNHSGNPVAALTNRRTDLYITDLPAVVGRNDSSVDVYFFHESVSREHCMFEYLNQSVTVRDLGSTVGTSINGKKLEPNTPYYIEDGAKITIGKVKFVFHADYEEIARRESAKKSIASSQDAFSKSGSNEQNRSSEEGQGYEAVDAKRGHKVVTVEARMLTEYEYGEDEVLYIECGLKPGTKPLSFTAEIKKTEVEDELKKTHIITKEEIKKEEEAIAAGPSLAEAEESDEPERTVSDSKDIIKKSLRLSWIDDETGKTKDVTIDQFPFSIGRKSDENDYALRRKGVSRKHMHFENVEDKIYIVDDNSTNGVKLNGIKIKVDERTEVKSGDRISLGGITVTLRME